MNRKIRPAKILDQDVFESYLAEIASWEREPETIFLNMDGEPLQDPLFCQRVEALKNYDLARLTTLQTNGQLLDEEKAQAILNAGLAGIVFGFDGATKEIYEAHRVRCVYETVLANIKMFVSMRDVQSSTLPIQIKFVRTKRNCHEVRAAYQLFGSLMNGDRDIFWDTLALDWGNALSAKGDGELYYIPRLEREQPVSGCSSVCDQMIVTVNDALAACCFDYNFQVSSGGYPIRNGSLLDSWRCKERLALQEALGTQNLTSKPEKCRSCPALYRFKVKDKTAPEVPEACVSENDLGYCYRFGVTLL